MSSMHFLLGALPQARGCPSNSKGVFQTLDSNFASRTSIRELSTTVATIGYNYGYHIETKLLPSEQSHITLTIL